MKITIYELLGMVKDGKVPKKVRYRYNYLYKDFKFDGETSNYISDKDFLFGEDITAMLNDEVEILEEEPKVQVELTKKEYLEYLDKIDEYMKSVRNYIPKPSFLELEEEKKIPEKLNIYNYDENDIMCKVNEIIDFLKSKGE